MTRRTEASDPLAIVLRAVPSIRGPGRFSERKVFISSLWHEIRGEIGMTLPAFKRWLVQQHRTGRLVLARADLVAAMDPDLVRESEIEVSDGGRYVVQFHFVTSEPTIPAATRTRAAPPAATVRSAADPDILRIVLDAARRMPDSGRYADGRNVFISEIWHRIGPRIGMTLPEFKRYLLVQNRAQRLTLARADLVDDMDPRKVMESEMNSLGAQFHFVVDEGADQAATHIREDQDEMTSATNATNKRPAQIRREIHGFLTGSGTTTRARTATDGKFWPGGTGGGGSSRERPASTGRPVIRPHAMTSTTCRLCRRYHTTEEHARHGGDAGVERARARAQAARDRAAAKKRAARDRAAAKKKATRDAAKTRAAKKRADARARAAARAEKSRAAKTARANRTAGKARTTRKRTPAPRGPGATGRAAPRRAMARATEPAPRDTRAVEPRPRPISVVVTEAIRGMPPSGRFGDKVFISEIYRRATGGDPAGGELGMSLPAFKHWLVEANRRGEFPLARADLVGAMDPRRVSESEIENRGATFHFVLDPAR